MARRIVAKRPYTPDPGPSVGTNCGAEARSDSEGDEFIDVETVASGQIRAAHFVDVTTTSSIGPQDRTVVRKLPTRTIRPIAKFRSLIASVPVRSTPRVTLVGRGRPECSNPALLNIERSQERSEHGEETTSAAQSKRVPILANEGIGTYAVHKLPLEEMTMSTRALRAIQEDHSLAKMQCSEDGNERVSFFSSEEEKPISMLTSARPSTSSGTTTSAPKKLGLSLACAHPHCPSTFSCVDDLVSHLVIFHCQHQFRQRKLTFVTWEKYEVWKTTHEKTHDVKMVVDGNGEEIEGVFQLRYYCEYCGVLGQQSHERGSRKEDKVKQFRKGCPAHFTASFNQEKKSVIIVGCLAHFGHEDKTGALEMTTSRKSRTKPSQAKCKYCNKWYASRVLMNRHVKEMHSNPAFVKGTTIECGDPHCDVVCDRMSTLCEHVAQEHGRKDLIIEEFRFPDIAKFQEWRQEVETGTVSKFVLSSSRTRASGVVQSYFLCHLSGFANRSRHSAPPMGRLRSTKKLGRYCTAFMNTKEYKDGTVFVQCCLGHFGHGFDVRQLPLPDKVKDEVTDLLLKGASTYAVYDTVRHKYTQSERGYYLQRYEVRNIADRLRKRGLLPAKEKERLTFQPVNPLRSKTTGKHPAQGVRFQSIRSLAEWRAISCERVLRCNERVLRFAKMDDLSGVKPERAVEQNHYSCRARNTSNLTTSSAAGQLRDVSPPIIGTSGYMEFQGTSGYDGEEMIVADEDESLNYFVDDGQHAGNLLEMIHTERDPAECASSSAVSKVVPLLMEPQPTGNVSFDENMNDIRRKIQVLLEQKRRTQDANKISLLLSQIRDLQGQLVRSVPQTTGFLPAAEQEFDGEEDGEDVQYEPIGDDAVCFEVEVESSEAPSKGGAPVSVEQYEELGYEAEPYEEEVVTAGYELL